MNSSAFLKNFFLSLVYSSANNNLVLTTLSMITMMIKVSQLVLPARSALRGCSGSGAFTRATRAWITWQKEINPNFSCPSGQFLWIFFYCPPGRSWLRASNSQRIRLASRPDRTITETSKSLEIMNYDIHCKHMLTQPGLSRRCWGGRSLCGKTPDV